MAQPPAISTLLFAGWGVERPEPAAAARGSDEEGELAAETAVRPVVAASGEEAEFLKEHADILKQSTTDRVAQRMELLRKIYRATPTFLIVFWVILSVGFVIVAFPSILNMIVQMFRNKLAFVKLALIMGFVFAVLAVRIFFSI
jgi:hypothetical protein